MKNPGFASVAVISLALGIGANTTIFTLINAVFLNPLPVERPSELQAVLTVDATNPGVWTMSYPNYRDVRDENAVFTGLAAYSFPNPGSLSARGRRAGAGLSRIRHWQLLRRSRAGTGPRPILPARGGRDARLSPRSRPRTWFLDAAVRRRSEGTGLDDRFEWPPSYRRGCGARGLSGIDGRLWTRPLGSDNDAGAAGRGQVPRLLQRSACSFLQCVRKASPRRGQGTGNGERRSDCAGVGAGVSGAKPGPLRENPASHRSDALSRHEAGDGTGRGRFDDHRWSRALDRVLQRRQPDARQSRGATEGDRDPSVHWRQPLAAHPAASHRKHAHRPFGRCRRLGRGVPGARLHLVLPPRLPREQRFGADAGCPSLWLRALDFASDRTPLRSGAGAFRFTIQRRRFAQAGFENRRPSATIQPPQRPGRRSGFPVYRLLDRCGIVPAGLDPRSPTRHRIRDGKARCHDREPGPGRLRPEPGGAVL